MAKKILIHSLIFSPDGVSTAYLYNDIALRFQSQGYEVVVLTTTPHYNVIEDEVTKQPLSWKVWGICKESDFHGIKVLHVPQKKFKSTGLRLLGFVYWHVVSFLIALFLKDVDVILSPSPPLTIGMINLWLAKMKKCKVIYNVQEIYPDILHKDEGMIVSFLRKMEHYVYNYSSAVTTIDQVFYNTIEPRFENKSKLHIIPNFVDTQLYSPSVGSVNELDIKLFPHTDSLKLLYAGNIGFAQDWETLVLLSQRSSRDNIEYFVIGEGVMKSFLEQKKMEYGLEKLHIIPYQSRSLMPSILAYSDIQYIFMDSKMDMEGFPSKVYTIMACAKPLLVCSGKNTPIINFLNDKDCAKLITTSDSTQKVEEMYQWLKSVQKEQLVQLGKNGMTCIQKTYSKEVVTKQYVDLVDSIL